MSPTLVLLRLLAVLVVPLLVAPSIVTVGSRPLPAVRPAALALSVATQAAALADPLAPPTIPAVRPARAADAVPARAPAAPVGPAQAGAPVEQTPPAPAVTDDAGAEGAAKAAAAATPTQPKAEAAPEGTAAPAAKAPDAQATGTKAAATAPGTTEQADEARAPAAAPAPPSGAPRSLYLGVGHGRAPDGRWQPGAEHPRTGAFEVDAAQLMVDAMVEVLRDAPNLELHAESGDHPNMIGSVARANALGVDDCIEVHQDTAAAPPGAFGHWFAGATAANHLADRLVGAIAEQGVTVRHDWHRARSGLYWVRKSECRAVLMEVGRVGDFTPEQLRRLGRAMAEAYLADTAEARGAS